MCGWSQRLLSRSISTWRKWEDSESNFFHEKEVQLPRLDILRQFQQFQIQDFNQSDARLCLCQGLLVLQKNSSNCKPFLETLAWRIVWEQKRVFAKVVPNLETFSFVFKLYNYVLLYAYYIYTIIYYVRTSIYIYIYIVSLILLCSGSRNTKECTLQITWKC